MSKYFINILLLLSLGTAIAQNNVKDSVKGIDYKEKYGLRVGVDLSKPIRAAFDENYKGLEFTGDFRISHKFYIAGELGTEELTRDEDNFNFSASGSYLKLGFDWNSYENWYGMENLITVGMRAGVSAFSQSLNSYTIYSNNQYWGETTGGQQGSTLIGKYDGLNAQWLEVVLGIKVELFNNLFMGVSTRLNYLVNDTEADQINNLFIPGFNKVTGGSRFGVGYNYTLSYLIPLFKTDKPEKKKEDKK